MLLVLTLKCPCLQPHHLCLSPWAELGHCLQPQPDPCPLWCSPKGSPNSSSPFSLKHIRGPFFCIFVALVPPAWKAHPHWVIHLSELSQGCCFLLAARTSPGPSSGAPPSQCTKTQLSKWQCCYQMMGQIDPEQFLEMWPKYQSHTRLKKGTQLHLFDLC